MRQANALQRVAAAADQRIRHPLDAQPSLSPRVLTELFGPQGGCGCTPSRQQNSTVWTAWTALAPCARAPACASQASSNNHPESPPRRCPARHWQQRVAVKTRALRRRRLRVLRVDRIVAQSVWWMAPSAAPRRSTRWPWWRPPRWPQTRASMCVRDRSCWCALGRSVCGVAAHAFVRACVQLCSHTCCCARAVWCHACGLLLLTLVL